MLPVWSQASRQTARTLKARQVPLLAVSAAFTFIVMMFNIPVPGGSTGHATGAVLSAILLGPWAACLAVSVSLVIQAFLFGDGGITTIGANSFNMAFVLTFGGYFVYRLLSWHAPAGSARRVLAAGAAGYIGLNLAAVFTGIEFGIQPFLYRDAAGHALYCPYGLKTALTAMMSAHLLFFGWAEGLVTALVVKYLQSSDGGELLK